MDIDLPPEASGHDVPGSDAYNQQLDLVGGPFAVIESDPGVFTSLVRRMGMRNLELVELYDIEPWAVDHLSPYGLIFCFLWHKDSHRPADFNDPAAERVWFANQLSDDACASHALLNVVLNCPTIEIGEELRMFKKETEKMSPIMKGLAISSSPMLREAHNSFARPADIRGALNSIAITTLEAQKQKQKQKQKQSVKRDSKPPPAKRAKSDKGKKLAAKEEDSEGEGGDAEETYHFIGYVPAYGKVWELDGLKSGPLEVGEFLPTTHSASESYPISSPDKGWMDVVRPALRMKMEKYGGSAEGGSNIRFSLLAIVDGLYEKASDELEFFKRERAALEKRLSDRWEEKVDATLLSSAKHIFSSPLGITYAQDFGARRMSRDLEIMEMPERSILPAWEICAQNAIRAKIALEDEISKVARSNTDHIKRKFDYEPFFNSFVERLHREGLLNALLDRDDSREKDGAIKRKASAR